MGLKLFGAMLLCCAAHAATLRYWVQPCAANSGCVAGDVELADWALEAWQSASGGRLQFTKTEDLEKAHIRIYWAGAGEGLYGEARPIVVDGARGAEVYVRPAPGVRPGADPLLRDAIVYLTCLHETGHALGLVHTGAFADIMYSFQYGGNIPEYFGRYRRQLSARADIRRYSGMSDRDRRQLAERYR